jgi:hypothetical protein
MKIKARSNYLFFVMLMIGAGIAALYIGFETYSRYPNVVQGIQGIATLYLIYLFYFPPKNFVKKPIGDQLEFPKVLKYIFPDFFLYIIIYWSIHSVSIFLRTVMHLTW